MALSWNEIKDRAVAFSKEWEDTTNEEAEAKSFIEAFFNIFGVTRKRVGTFEHRVKKLNEGDGYIDLLWKGVILIEMKSKGKNLDKVRDFPGSNFSRILSWFFSMRSKVRMMRSFSTLTDLINKIASEPLNNLFSG